MEKHFKLPKQFIEDWIAALRSGEYGQVDSVLASREYDDEGDLIEDSSYSFCCLGVGMNICGTDPIDIEGIELPESFHTKPDNYPIELFDDRVTKKQVNISDIPGISTLRDADLIGILSSMNDNLTCNYYDTFIKAFPNCKFEKIPKPKQSVQYSFEEIAHWIEQNIEMV